MTLHLLFDPDTVADMLTAWPDKPSVHRIPADSPIPHMITAATLDDYLATGCVPPSEVNVLQAASVRHPSSFTAGRWLDPAKVAAWQQQGCTVQLRNLDRWLPPAAAVLRSIQRHTGCAGYLSAFITPGGEQGLSHHWDQSLGVIVQLEGSKTWELWAPTAEQPMRSYKESTSVPAEQWTAMLRGWIAASPDMAVTLTPGDVLVLPRGWVHNPHSRDTEHRSVHLTFVIEERTPLNIAEALAQAAIADPAFRAAIPPGQLTGVALEEEVERAIAMLGNWLSGIDIPAFAGAWRRAAEAETHRAQV